MKSRHAWCILVLAAGCAGNDAGEPATLPPEGADTSFASIVRREVDAVRSLRTPPDAPNPGEWRAQYDEPGQTFAEYLDCSPTLPTPARRMIHVQPLGALTAAKRNAVRLTAEYIHLAFDLPVVIDPPLVPGALPRSARRRRSNGTQQTCSMYIIDSLLRPRLPDDAMSVLAITSADLWPGGDMNFVFGQGSLRHRVGVWSLHRLGSPDARSLEFRQLMMRAVKIATHELGHMFSMLHCTRYRCTMQDPNSLAETDRTPLAFCPECMAKICWATRGRPAHRYAQLAGFCERNGLAAEAAFFRSEQRRAIDVVRADPGGDPRE